MWLLFWLDYTPDAMLWHGINEICWWDVENRISLHIVSEGWIRKEGGLVSPGYPCPCIPVLWWQIVELIESMAPYKWWNLCCSEWTSYLMLFNIRILNEWHADALPNLGFLFTQYSEAKRYVSFHVPRFINGLSYDELRSVLMEQALLLFMIPTLGKIWADLIICTL